MTTLDSATVSRVLHEVICYSHVHAAHGDPCLGVSFGAEVARALATPARAQGRAEALDVLRDIAENSYHAATRHDDGGFSPTCGTCMARAAIKEES
jgi:hypothetical protein